MKQLLPFLILLMLSVSHAHFMSAIWPQKHLDFKAFGSKNAKYKVIIAGTKSEFRDEIVASLADSLVAESVFVQTMSIKLLKSQKLANWNAIVLTNTCISWDIEEQIKSFIKNNQQYQNFIILTTSGDPDSCCESSKYPPGVDAISGGSIVAKKAWMINQVLWKIRQKLNLPSAKSTNFWNKTLDGKSGATK